jgi:hypothetical protein
VARIPKSGWFIREAGTGGQAMTPTTERIAPAHSGLLDISEVQAVSDDDERCFAELEEVLTRHGALQRFGLHLLHTHFPIYEDEVLVEECDEENRTLTLRPMKRSGINEDNLMQTNWRLDIGASMRGCEAYCLMDAGQHVARKHAAT